MDDYRNFALSTVVSAPVPPTTGGTLTVADATQYPLPPFNAVICPTGKLPVATNAEIVRVTAIVGSVLTITRMQESSSARAIVVGDLVYASVTEKLIDDLFASITPGPTGPPGPQGPAGTPGTSGVVDATYWVSSAHAGLVNERSLGALANGYVKSTAGEPSTVASIPVADGGTGATTAAQARTNLGLGTMAVQNANAVAITGGSIQADGLTSTATIYAVGNISTSADLHSTNVFTTNVTATGNIEALNSTTRTTHLIATGNMSVAGSLAAGSFSGNGANLTNLNATNLATGVAAPARLGTGTPTASTYLRGDGAWATPPGGVPSGLIVLSVTPCPAGWTRIVWDGLFLRVGPSPQATGGASTHDHGGNINISGTTGVGGAHSHSINGMSMGGPNVLTSVINGTSGTLTYVPIDNHVHPLTNRNTDGVGDHAHAFSGGGPINAASNLPPYVDVFLCQKD